MVNQPSPPTIKQLGDLFMKEGVQLSVNACKNALAEWGGDARDITHVVSTTCTSSANPGYDHFVTTKLGIPQSAEKVLLAGIGCSGGLAALRVAANFAMGASYRQRPARILVIACEISSILARSELESIHVNQEVRIAACLFSDAASACIVSNGIGLKEIEKVHSFIPVYRMLGWSSKVIRDTETDLGFDVDPLGWKVVLTPRVPNLTSTIAPDSFRDLVDSIPSLHDEGLTSPSDFDWALHPGGSLIIQNVQSVLGLSEHHLRASYEIYIKHGNSSSATIVSVLDTLRRKQHVADGRDNLIACAFGPGITIEMMALRRGRKGGF